MPQAGTGRRLNAIAGLALVAVAMIAGWVLVREIAVKESGVRLAREAPPPLVDEAEPRAALAEAMLLAQSSAKEPEGPSRSAMLDHAGRLAAGASETRAHWGDAWMVRSYIAAMRRPDGTESLAALERSYADAPFLRNAAGWRIEYGIARWADLSRESRRRVIGEAIVLAQFDPDSTRRVFALARGTDAYLPLAAAWRGIVHERQIERTD